MPLQTPTPDEILELFRNEVVVREGAIEDEYQALLRGEGSPAWARPYPGVETLATAAGPTLMLVTYRRLLGRGAYEEADRIRHELRDLSNDVRAALPDNAQVEFARPGFSHVDRPEGLELLCVAHGIVRTSP